MRKNQHVFQDLVKFLNDIDQINIRFVYHDGPGAHFIKDSSNLSEFMRLVLEGKNLLKKKSRVL